MGKIALRFHQEADIRDVIGFYEDQGNVDKMIEFEQELIQYGYAKEADLSNLAFILAKEGDQEGAIKTLDLMPEGEFESIETVLLYVTLLLENGQEEKALGVAMNFDERKHDVPSALRLADLFENANLTEMALQVLDPFKDELQSNPLLLTTYAAYAEKVGKSDQVYELLDALFQKGQLPPDALSTYLTMLIDRKLTDRLEEVLGKIDLDALDDATIIDLLEYSDHEFVPLVQSRISKERLDSSPILTLIFLAFEPSKGDFSSSLEKFHLKAPELVDLSRDLMRLNLPKWPY